MEFSLNISNENFILNVDHQCLASDDASYKPKNHLNFCSDNFVQSSLSGWPRLPNLTNKSHHNHKNRIPLISNQNYDSPNRRSEISQNHPIDKAPKYKIPSNDPFMGIDSSSSIDTFDESMNTIKNNNKIYMTHNTSISTNPMGMIDSFHNFGGNTIWNETVNNKELTNNIKGYEAAFDRMMGESQSFDMLAPKGIKNATREVLNQHEDQKIIKNYQKQNKNLVKKSKSLKKGNIIKGKWTESEDIKLKEIVELYGNKKWRMIAKKLEGRIGKQCRERWYNHLRPDIKKDVWTEEEDQILIKAHMVVGTKWIKIAQQLPGRSENTIKNHWNTTKRRIQKQNDKNAIPSDNNILENYIRNVMVNKDDLPKAIETNDETPNTKDEDDSKDMLYGEMNLSLDAKTHTVKPLDDVSAISPYVPMPEKFTWENSTTEVCESMDYIEMLMDGWE